MNFISRLRATSLHGHRWLLAVVTGYTLAAILVAAHYGMLEQLSLLLRPRLYLVLLGLYLGILALARLLYVMIWVRPHRLTLHLLGEVRDWLTIERLLASTPVLLTLPLFIGSFTFFKTMIPVIHPFHWDSVFASWDRMLHGGLQPWQWLQPLLGHPWLTSTVNFIYNAWIFVIYVVLYWQIFSLSRSRLRMQFLVILIGSVHLGWHYAIDGYLAWVLAGSLWWAVGRFLDYAYIKPCTSGQARK